MSKSRRGNRDQLRARQEAALEKKWIETMKQQHSIRNKSYDASIAKELAADMREEEIYRAGLAEVYGDVDNKTLQRRIRDLEEELLETTGDGSDVVELLKELQDELARRDNEA